jgi:hypothetical protein
MSKGKVWSCKIGPAPEKVPSGGDYPLRMAVREAFYEMFGREDEICFSGWGDEFSEGEHALLVKVREEKKERED